MDALHSGTLVTPEIERQMTQLAARLQNTSGKKVYGYLKRDVKNLIDQIVDELAKDTRVNALYQAWGRWNNEVLLTYQKEAPPLPPLSGQPQFKSIKNMVITEAMKLGGHNFTFEDEQMRPSMELDALLEPTEPSAPEDADAAMPEWTPRARTSHSGGRSSMWSDRYQEARRYLFGDKTSSPVFVKAYELFLQEAKSGNPLAMHDLGRMFADGLGREIDLIAAQDWYAKALAAFQVAEQTVWERQKPYLQYRIGKMFAAGLGTEQDYTQAANWFAKAVAANHKYAQYSLAGLYYRGQGVVQSYEQAFHLYGCSAEQGNPYASYELAKMFRDGIGTKKETVTADKHFKDAFVGFYHLEQDSHDDKLQYRLGQMLHTGTGTEQDDIAAADYWERSAKLGNPNAQYALGKLWLENGTGDPEQAVAWIAKAAEGGNADAQYSLAKLYRDGESVERDIGRAVEFFMLSAEQKNEYAAFALGKLYLAGEDIPCDVDAAIKWLSVSADLGNSFAQYTLAKLYLTGEDVAKNVPEALKLLHQSAEQENKFAEYQLGRIYLAGEDVPKDVEAAILWLSRSADRGNQFAQYALGKLYLCGHDVPRDKEKAIPFLQASAAQGNIYAQFLLVHLDTFRDPSAFLAATRLLHRLENLFREDYRKAAGGAAYHIDRKRRRKLAEKKQAQGHKRDDQEPIRQQTY